MKNNIILLFLILLPVLVSCEAAHKKANDFVNLFRSVSENDNVEYVTLPNGTMLDKRINEDTAVMIFKRFEAIENGDIKAFRATLAEAQDGVDYYYQLNLLFIFFGDFLGIDYDAFVHAVENSGEELEKISDALFRGEYPLRNRNTKLHIKKIDVSEVGGLIVTVINSENEEIIYNFTHY
ncbi:MAG: hypothetical protein FWD40_01265 [Treponema sp.]|nr:hypothetical protein [Treponema sp.]